MLQFDMTAMMRQDFGKGAMRSLRQQGQTPAILYGPKTDPLALALTTKEFTKTLLSLQGQNAVFSLEVTGGKSKKRRYVMLKEVQTDPVRDTLVHADFYEISIKDTITLSVPLKFVGKAKGVDMGGVLHVSSRTVHLQGLPLDIPDTIEIDITDLEINGPGVTCKDLDIPANVRLLEEDVKPCVSVVPASKSLDLEEEEGEGVAEGESEGASDETAAADKGEA
jgi:large subunit ribosomal protein L25